MSVEVKWDDIEPESGQRRFLCAEKFGGRWHFKFRMTRRGDWTRGLEPTKAMWRHLLDALERRFRRREGVSPEDVAAVKKILAEWKPKPNPFGTDEEE